MRQRMDEGAEEVREGDLLFLCTESEAWVKQWDGRGSVVQVPGSVKGKPVTKILPYAFCGGQPLKEIWLSDGVEEIGAHAFFNCKDLRKLTFPSSVREIGDGAFKNDLDFQTIHFFVTDQGPRAFGMLQYLMNDMERRMDVTITEADKSQARLVFPFFVVDYEEDYEARVFHEFSYGCGQQYRHCIERDHMDYRGYDRLFSDSVRQEKAEVMEDLALERLMYPVQLGREAKERYEVYLRQQAVSVGTRLIASEDRERLLFLAGMDAFSKEAADRLTEEALRLEKTAAVSLLMDYRHKRFSVQEKQFDL